MIIQAAIQLTNEQLGDLKNRLNSHRHINASKMKQLEELQTRYDLMVKEAEEAVQTDAGESETAAVCINISLIDALSQEHASTSVQSVFYCHWAQYMSEIKLVKYIHGTFYLNVLFLLLILLHFVQNLLSFFLNELLYYLET